MGKGDKKTKRGKIKARSHGIKRPKTKIRRPRPVAPEKAAATASAGVETDTRPATILKPHPQTPSAEPPLPEAEAVTDPVPETAVVGS